MKKQTEKEYIATNRGFRKHMISFVPLLLGSSEGENSAIFVNLGWDLH
jgi:hypothetical protein